MDFLPRLVRVLHTGMLELPQPGERPEGRSRLQQRGLPWLRCWRDLGW